MGKTFSMHLMSGLAALMVVSASPGYAEVTFEWVTIGNPGNDPDSLNEGAVPGIGSVPYVYRIARHEVTNEQYAQFLTAVAVTDTNGLYSTAMGSEARGGITQSGSPGTFTYSVKTDMGDKPVMFVSYFDAMRFVNWLHNGQPTGAQGAGTTETGVYTISDGLSESRAVDALFFIPTENEWYKAAHHQPAVQGGDADDYWLYPTASNGLPTIATADAIGDVSNAGANVANYQSGADWNEQDGNVTTVGSAGPSSGSFYGTTDQGGNVAEWSETVESNTHRVQGGAWGDDESALRSSGLSYFVPSADTIIIGFRVASPVAKVTFDWVTVGNPGNAPDPLNQGVIPGIGSVPDVYRIAKHEVTNEQYATFLNSVAATDTFGLYSASMGSDPRGGITQSGSAPHLTYGVKPNMGDKPVNFVSFLRAMRFVNWLHNGQPIGAQDASTTEGGVYAIGNGLTENRASGARYFIPTENEWYKAAFYQPAAVGGDIDDYWLYPTATNAIPAIASANATGDIGNPGANIANYNSGADWNEQDGNVTTVGSAGALSQSHYGTSDQGGNLWEWNETVVSGFFRGRRGGSWDSFEDVLRSSFQSNGSPTLDNVVSGFRVAGPIDDVPTVSEWGLVTMALVVMCGGTIILSRVGRFRAA